MRRVTKPLLIIFALGLIMVIISVYNGLSFSAIDQFLNDDATYGEKQFYTEETAVHTIVLDIVDRSVFIAQGNNPEVTFNYYAHEDDTWTITEVDGVLTIRQQKPDDVLSWINYKMITQTLKNMYITLPSNRDMNLDLTNHVGNISIYQNNRFFESINVDLGVGILGIRDVTINNLDIELGTGSMLLTNLTVEGDLLVDSHTGSVKLDGGSYQVVDISNDTGTIVLTDLSANALDLFTATGNVSTNNIIIANSIVASTRTGKVIINSTMAAGYDLTTITGDIIVVFDSGDLLFYDLSASIGKITIDGTDLGTRHLTYTGTIPVKGRVTTGSIRITTQ